MGVYLSSPKLDKDSSDSENSWLKCGSSSMQGWRYSQEDAHNCLLEFDKNVAMFAVYDGHGGHEVAKYAAKELPEFIKRMESYNNSDFESALKEAFLKFDESLITDEVMSELKVISKCVDGISKGDESDADDTMDDLQALRAEANMSLEEVIASYACGKGANFSKLILNKALTSNTSSAPSPCLKPKSSTSSTSDGCCPGSSSSSSEDSFKNTVNLLSNGLGKQNGHIDNVQIASCSRRKVKPRKSPFNSDTMHIEAESSKENKDSIETEKFDVEKNDKDSKTLEKKDDNSEVENKSDKEVSKENSDCKTIEKSDEEKVSAPEVEKVTTELKSSPVLQMLYGSDDDSSEDDDDSNYVLRVNEASSDEDVDKDDVEDEEPISAEDSSSGGEDAENEEPISAEDSSSDSDEDDDDNDNNENGDEAPGRDSGCTAVVALLQKDKVYVANAGDSRAILCRNGIAIDLSCDHKPDDPLELKRIINAGGGVSPDGRVNGGLNLSRALGDHSYKQKANLCASEQMISALPDVKIENITTEDEFIVLACDGIWNSMSSQDVVDFVKPLIDNGEKLSVICEKLFDKCLAPDTSGDGTGCDNMTCVIVKLKKDNLNGPSEIKEQSEVVSVKEKNNTECENSVTGKLEDENSQCKTLKRSSSSELDDDNVQRKKVKEDGH